MPSTFCDVQKSRPLEHSLKYNIVMESKTKTGFGFQIVSVLFEIFLISVKLNEIKNAKRCMKLQKM